MIRNLHSLSTALMLVLLVSACTSEMEGQAEVLYFKIGYETAFPITPKSIVDEHSGSALVEVSDPRFREVMRLIDGAGPGSFYESATRARIRDGKGTTIYLDNYGGIRQLARETSLSESDLERVADLLGSIALQQQFGGLPGWAIDATHAYIAENEGWPKSDYNLIYATSPIDYEAGRVVVRANHHDDRNVYDPETETLQAGGGKSFELHFNVLTRALMRTVRYQ